MTVVYRIDTGKFEPISHGSNYLYSQYDRIQSFLVKQKSEIYKAILAKPVLSGEQVLWYANFNQSFSRISELSEEVQIAVKTRYWEVRQQIDQDIQKLTQSADKEKRSWGDLLREVFNDDNNILLSDGQDWCLLWGWKFRNKTENYLAPEFMPKPITPVSEGAGVASTGVSAGSTTSTLESASTPQEVPLVTTHQPSTRSTVARVRPSLWDRIKRFLRTFVYRFWGLLLLIMFILFLACLFKKCSNKRMRQSCEEMEQLNKRLLEVDKKVQERCEQKK